ncbi:unconventional myosin-VIIa-like, partial [Limulus polyphemus]|uniref:Unconventional myosin-VIIa-like n=1 Tax=Limulus polyphemus TaxID=6850 RepID=A0ABM1C156_LIMPO
MGQTGHHQVKDGPNRSPPGEELAKQVTTRLKFKKPYSYCDKIGLAAARSAPAHMHNMGCKGDLVWFDPGVGYLIPGEVLEYSRPAQVVTVQAVISGQPQSFTLTNLTSVKKRQDLGQNGIEDMVNIVDLNEASLLWNLKIRYEKEFIYTYTGSILVAVNPYKMFDIYGLEMVKKYEGQILGTLPP